MNGVNKDFENNVSEIQKESDDKGITKKGNYLEQKNNKTTAIILGVLVILIIASVILYDKLGSNYKNGIMSGENMTSVSDERDSSKDEDLQDAPDFEVEDNSGKKVKLSDMKGKPVVVNFWASWCMPCKSEMPDFDKVYKKYSKEITFMMVNMTDGGRETKENALGFIKGMGYEFPVYFDVEQIAAYAYNVTGIPATYFINSDGKIVAYASGAIDGEAIEEGISRIK